MFTSADGWYACYQSGEGFVYWRVATWILDDDGDVSGIDIGSDGRFGSVEVNDNFVGYFYHPSSKAASFVLSDARNEESAFKFPKGEAV